jgi:hypothetical protein
MVVFLLAGCSGSDSGPTAPPNNELEIAPQSNALPGTLPFAGSYEQLGAYIKKQFAESVLRHRDPWDRMEMGEAQAAYGEGESGYTRTNNQEPGVDEADAVKTDGAYFYLTDGRNVRIVDISDPMEVKASFTVDGNVDSLHLYHNKLIVLYRSWPEYDPQPLVSTFGEQIGIPFWISPHSVTGAAIYDVTDPAHPKEIKVLEFDGYLVSSRRIDNRLHLVQQFRPDLPPALELEYDGSRDDLDETISRNMAAMDRLPLEALIPFYHSAKKHLEADPSEVGGRLPVVAPENMYYPQTEDGGGAITTVVTFDLGDPDLPFTSVGLVADAHQVYASPQALYIVNQNHTQNLPDPSGGPQTPADGQPMEQSVIFKFDLAGETVAYTGSGRVNGWILNQFSLGEHQGVLRMATTTGRMRWDSNTKTANHVYCLKPEQGELKIIGKLENLAPGEDIYAARFVGGRGFLVTFVRVDPLFTLDLSDPADPKVIGELKVPGYSAYIHMYGDNHLITIGKDVYDQDEEMADITYRDDRNLPLSEVFELIWEKGVQLSIFDISDFQTPRLLHKELIGDSGTESEALYNHKAFMFWQERNLLAIPIELFEAGEMQTDRDAEMYIHDGTFKGLYVYSVSVEKGFDLIGRISTVADMPYPYPDQPYADTDGPFLPPVAAESEADIADVDANGGEVRIGSKEGYGGATEIEKVPGQITAKGVLRLPNGGEAWPAGMVEEELWRPGYGTSGWHTVKWTRGIFVDQKIYAVTNNSIHAARIEQIEETISALYYDEDNAWLE